MVWGLLYHSPTDLNSNHTMALCDQFATYFADKIIQICSEVDASVDACPDDVPLVSASLIYMNTFQLVDSKDVVNASLRVGAVTTTVYSKRR